MKSILIKYLFPRNGIKNKNFHIWSNFWRVGIGFAENIESLNNIYKNLVYSVEKRVNKINMMRLNWKTQKSYFLFISFATLISLLFVLRNSYFQWVQKSFIKFKNIKEVYELLNKVHAY